MAQQQWFRLYTEIVGDRKLRRHAPAIRWVWVSLLCAIKQSPVKGEFYLSENVPGTFDDLADIAAVPLETVKEAIAIFKDQDMLSKDEGPLKALHWGDRQYESDSSTERTRRYRESRKGDCDDIGTSQERSCDGEGNDSVAPSDTEADTETDQVPNTPTPVTDIVQPIPLDATERERLILHELSHVPRYPLNMAKDLEYIRTVAIDFPTLDLLAEAKRWRAYKMDKPLKKNSNPRMQFRNWCEIAVGKNKQRMEVLQSGNPITQNGSSKPGKYDRFVLR